MNGTYVAVEIDTVLYEGETAADAVKTLATGFNLSVYVVAEVGPSGHLLLRIVGPRVEVARYLNKHGYEVKDYLCY